MDCGTNELVVAEVKKQNGLAYAAFALILVMVLLAIWRIVPLDDPLTFFVATNAEMYLFFGLLVGAFVLFYVGSKRSDELQKKQDSGECPVTA